MSSQTKDRKKLEKAGFTGQTLERAMELLERTNASILAELLVKMVTRQEKTPSMALHEAEIAVHGAARGGDQNAGTGDQTGALTQGTVLKKNKMK